MEQFVSFPASVYNKSLNTQPVTKQELPKYHLSQNPTYQIDSLKKEMNKKLFAKADSLVDKNLSCLCVELSNSQVLLYFTWRHRFISVSDSQSGCQS